MSNVDKRSITTDALTFLGTTVPLPDEAKRDAIHLAVEPVIAAEVLLPGTHIGLVEGKASRYAPKLIGIVDPFLPGLIGEGQRFYMVLYPRTITSLRHVWEHPEFEDEPTVAAVKKQEESLTSEETKYGMTKQEAEAWLREWCSEISYDDLVAVHINGGTASDTDDWGYSTSYSIDGEYLYSYGSDAHGEIPDKVWDCLEIVTGVERKNRPEWFSCSC